METQTCSRCGDPKPLSAFKKHRKVCRRCLKNRHKANSGGRVPNKVRAEAKRNLCMYLLKGAVGCCLCPENDPVCLDFHHVQAGSRVAWVSRSSWGRLTEELAKCVVLCANCHRKSHARLLRGEIVVMDQKLDIITPIRTFIERLGFDRWEGSAFFHDDTHRVTVEELPNGNARFSAATLIAGDWYAMGSYEIEVGQRYFWTRVVEALRLYCGATFAMPDGLVASVAQGLAGADLLTQERARDEQVLPRAKPKAGAKLPVFEGTIKSARKTKTRGGDDHEEDVIDQT